MIRPMNTLPPQPIIETLDLLTRTLPVMAGLVVLLLIVIGFIKYGAIPLMEAWHKINTDNVELGSKLSKRKD